jgi:hypothetical protein
MQRSGIGPSTQRRLASIPFNAAPGVGWRMHMSKIATDIRAPNPFPAKLVPKP